MQNNSRKIGIYCMYKITSEFMATCHIQTTGRIDKPLRLQVEPIDIILWLNISILETLVYLPFKYCNTSRNRYVVIFCCIVIV